MEFDFSNPELYLPVYRPLLHNSKRTKLLYGGRGSGKSMIAVQKMVIKCLDKPPGKFKCLMTRKMKEDVRESIYATVKDVILMWNLGKYFQFYEGTPKIVCHLNGNSFLPKGLNQTGGKSGNAKSVRNPTDAIVDEADEITLHEYIKFTGSLRGSRDIEEYLIFNPPEEDHWIVKMFFPPKETFELQDGSHTYIKSIVEHAIIVHTTHENNPFLSAKERMGYLMLKDTHPEYYATECLGLLKATKKGGEALKHFDATKHVKSTCVFDRQKRILECWDFNKRPHHTVGIWQFGYSKEDKVFEARLVKEFTESEASVREVQTMINNWLKTNNYEPTKIRLIGDHQGTRNNDWDIDALLTKIKRQIKRGGFGYLDETTTNPRVVTSIEFLNDLCGDLITLSSQSNYPGRKVVLRVNPSCKYHVADFQKTKTGKDGKLVKMEKTEVIKDGSARKKIKYQIRGHAVDAARYMAVNVFNTEYYDFRKKD